MNNAMSSILYTQNCAQFFAIVYDKFAFLEQKGFACSDGRQLGYECSVTYKTHNKEIVVFYEMGFRPWILLTWIIEHKRQSAALDALVQKYAPKHSSATPMTELVAEISRQANYLKDYGKSFFDEETTALSELKIKYNPATATATGYARIDSQLSTWAKALGGTVQYHMRDDETRIVIFTDDQGKSYRLILSNPDIKPASMTLWDYGSAIKTIDYDPNEITTALAKMTILLQAMVEAAGHSRTLYH